MITYELISNEVEKKMPKGIVFRLNNKQNWRNARVPYPFPWGTNLPVVKFHDTDEAIIAHQFKVPFEKAFDKPPVFYQNKPPMFNEKNETTFHIITIPEFEKYIKDNANA